MPAEARGLFISFEGIDGSGKSTQARRLAETLRARGREVVLTREPGGSPGAEEIRRLLLTGEPGRWSPETEALLFTAARRDHLERTIRPALARGAVVVTDRFADSTRAFQGATRGDLSPFVDRLHQLAVAQEPDLTLLLDMDPARGLARSLARLGAQRGAEGRFEAMGEAFQARVREGYLRLAAACPERVLRIDAERPEADVAAEILAATLARLR
jgi:dTMP kinase